MSEQASPAPAPTYGKWKEGVDSSYTGWILTLAKLAFLGYLIVNRDAAAEIVGFGSELWKMVVFVLCLHVFGSFAMTVASVRCHKHTGIIYGHDRKAFALVGGFDVGWWPIFAAQAGLYGAYWWTSTQASDPLDIVREPWYFIAISTVLGLVLTGVAAEIVFPRPQLLRRLQMKAKLATDTRLELSHRTMPFMLLAGLASLAGAVWIYLGDPGWKEWIGIGILVVVGLLLVLGACSSYVVFDRRAGFFEARHRYLFGTKRHQERLADVSAIAVRRDRLGSSLLAVICVRVGGSDLPITMFGSPFGAAIHHDATRIAQFLELPLVVEDRLVIQPPESQLEDVLAAGIGKIAVDPLAAKYGDTEQAVDGFRATCPNCENAETVPWHRALDPSAYRLFALELEPVSGSLALRCRNCGAPAALSPAGS